MMSPIAIIGTLTASGLVSLGTVVTATIFGPDVPTTTTTLPIIIVPPGHQEREIQEPEIQELEIQESEVQEPEVQEQSEPISNITTTTVLTTTISPTTTTRCPPGFNHRPGNPPLVACK